MGRDLHSSKVKLHILVGAKTKAQSHLLSKNQGDKRKSKKVENFEGRRDEMGWPHHHPTFLNPSCCTTTTIKIMLYSSYTYYQYQSFSFSLSAGLVGAVNTKICSN
ncbi:hypothetical protein L1887_21638 [Cichorium endivia]|nr:hypothetical protein L1887_21638 [Cichorium endivia]